MFNLMQELFSPGSKHTDDEQRRLEHTRVQEGVGDPGKGPIDLSSGRALIRPPEQRIEPRPEPSGTLRRPEQPPSAERPPWRLRPEPPGN